MSKYNVCLQSVSLKYQKKKILSLEGQYSSKYTALHSMALILFRTGCNGVTNMVGTSFSSWKDRHVVAAMP